MTAQARSWLGWIAVVLMLLASSTASATTGFLSGNSPLGENRLEGGVHQVSLTISAETHRGCGEGSLQDAAGLFVAPAAFDPFVGTGSNAGFGRLIGWGTGAQGASARTASITLQEIQQAGITRPVAEHWLNFYRNAVANGQGGAAAPERVRLMQRVLELLGGG